MQPITVAGEALIDIVAAERTQEIPGGSPANVALGLSRLGLPVDFVTWLGDDQRGHRIADHLTASGVHLSAGVFGAAHTSTATVRLSPDGQPTYGFDIEWDLPDLPQTPTWLHVGSIGAFLQPGARKVRELVLRTASSGGKVSFDPNIRAALLDDATSTRAWFETLAASTNVVKLSDEDAAWLYPHLDVNTVIDRLLHLGVELVVLTLGANGSILATGTNRIKVPGKHVTVVDTVGAGDTYMAALIWQLNSEEGSILGSLDEHSLIELGATSARAAAITVTRPGADLPTAADLLLASHGDVDAPTIETHTRHDAPESDGPGPSPHH